MKKMDIEQSEISKKNKISMNSVLLYSLFVQMILSCLNFLPKEAVIWSVIS